MESNNKQQTTEVRIGGKTVTIVIDNALNKYASMSLFQDKVDKANEMLERVGLPKQFYEEQNNNQ